MIKVVVIGAGNVAQHLISEFKKNNKIRIVQALARDTEKLLHLLDSEFLTSDFSQLKDADLYIIAVNDTAISDVSDKIPFSNKLVVHTSGSVAITELNNKNRKGVFYPLQTFSKTNRLILKKFLFVLKPKMKLISKCWNLWQTKFRMRFMS